MKPRQRDQVISPRSSSWWRLKWKASLDLLDFEGLIRKHRTRYHQSVCTETLLLALLAPVLAFSLHTRGRMCWEMVGAEYYSIIQETVCCYLETWAPCLLFHTLWVILSGSPLLSRSVCSAEKWGAWDDPQNLHAHFCTPESYTLKPLCFLPCSGSHHTVSGSHYSLLIFAVWVLVHFKKIFLLFPSFLAKKSFTAAFCISFHPAEPGRAVETW